MPAPDLFDLTDRVAVVLGGTTGIGLALSKGLAGAGAHVVASARRAEQVATAAAEIRVASRERRPKDHGRGTLEQTCDVLDHESLLVLRERVENEIGPVGILVNCAGVTRRQPSLEVSAEDWQRILDTNLTGTFRACQVFGEAMLGRGAGRIVNIASLASFVGLYEVAAYTASKAGVAGLTRALAVEWAPRGVAVNAIAPGVFETDLNRDLLRGTERGRELRARTPMGRFGAVDELVGAAIFLASDAAGFVTGEVLAVDGGFLASGVNQ
ncbi:MAG TPA: SDR family oxidoreductase [Thermoanaerobaculia bacterium]|nr:SDR family oxidoreductase [Thermoanaerobaculia bacterium]